MRAAEFYGFICVVFGLFFAVALPAIALLNHAIGKAHDDKVRAIEPFLVAEGIRFAEDDVRVIGTWIAPLAVGVHRTRANVRVTERAIYVMQSTRFLWMRIGQPVIAFPLRGAILEPRVAMNVKAGWLETYPREEEAAVILKGGLGVQRCTLRLAVRDVAGFLRSS